MSFSDRQEWRRQEVIVCRGGWAALAALSLGVGILLLVSGCSEPDTCEPRCSWWQDCLDGECRAADGHCDGHDDCGDELPICHVTERVCVAEGDPCALCEGWQECVGEECVPIEGRCGDSSDCPPNAPACCTDTNYCVEASAPYLFSEYPGAIITSDALAPAFDRLASIHTLTGVPTRIVTVEEICGDSCSETDPREDAPARIKEWLVEREELRYVVLGGGSEAVPAREVFATYSNSLLGVSFEESFVTDFYYADLSEWDKNGNGVYAEPEDRPDGGENGVLDYAADLAVARLPFSSTEEIERYTDKVVHHLSQKDLSRAREALLLSNIATTLSFGSSDYDIDGGLYFDLPGRTIDLMPADMSLTKLYALGPTEDSPDAEVLTVERQREEMEKGPNLIVHSGHGSEGYLTVEEHGDNAFSAQMARELVNEQYPIMLSCACLAANFAHPGGSTAGEELLNAPNGGAIGYLGNTTIGLGLGGGSQFIDEVLRCSFAGSNPRIGDCLIEAHEGFEYPDEIQLPLLGPVTVVDEDSWRWTKKSVVYFGDPMIPIVTDPSTAPPPVVLVSKQSDGELFEVRFDVEPPSAGVLTAEIENEHYRVEISAGEEAAVTIVSDPGSIRLGFVAEGSMPFFGEHVF